MYEQRVVSGMRPTGSLHLGHFHGALKNWVRLQSEYPCLVFVADWHALTTHYDTPAVIEEHVWDMVIDWLAAGIDPARATLFIQSRVPEHAELHTIGHAWAHHPTFADDGCGFGGHCEASGRWLVHASRWAGPLPCRDAGAPGRGCT